MAARSDGEVSIKKLVTTVKSLFGFECIKAITNVAIELDPGKIKNATKYCQIVLFSSKSATESLNFFTIFCFDLHSRWWYRLGCKWLSALLTLKEAGLKDPRCRQNKRFHKFL